MKEYEKLAEECANKYTAKGQVNWHDLVRTYQEAFLKAREMSFELLPNIPGVDFNAFRELGEKGE